MKTPVTFRVFVIKQRGRDSKGVAEKIQLVRIIWDFYHYNG
jgi:hypothetical protein